MFLFLVTGDSFAAEFAPLGGSDGDESHVYQIQIQIHYFMYL